jgi:D-alanyl-D-alanine carboxypeptidase (penicillin-binding protein 5/6)
MRMSVRGSNGCQGERVRMRVGRYLATLGAWLVVVWAAQASAGVGGRECPVTAQAVYAVDQTSGKVLCAKNARMRLYPASTVKLMTALVVLDRSDVQAEVIVSSRAANVEPTKAGLTAGASHSVGELLEVLLAASANDAAVALAEAVAGSEGEFAVLMNRKARELGMQDSHFTNATGLPNRSQRTSAHDLAILTRTAFQHPFVKTVMAKKRVTITDGDGRTISRVNHNKLLWRLDHPQVLGKTGYTRSAQHCYAGIAYYDDRRVSLVLLKSRKPWSDIFSVLGVPGRARR